MAGFNVVIGLMIGVSLVFVASAQPVADGCSKAAITCAELSTPENPIGWTFPHDTDCSMFCQCDLNGRVHAMVCPPGLEFTQIQGVCVLPEYSSCRS